MEPRKRNGPFHGNRILAAIVHGFEQHAGFDVVVVREETRGRRPKAEDLRLFELNRGGRRQWRSPVGAREVDAPLMPPDHVRDARYAAKVPRQKREALFGVQRVPVQRNSGAIPAVPWRP